MRLSLVLSLLAMACAIADRAVAQPRVVAAIKPVHSLVAAVMDGVAEPRLIVDGAASPHAYSLKPSQAEAIQDAELIFWVGPGLETFLQKAIRTIGAQAQVVTLSETPDLLRLPLRDGDRFATAHSHAAAEADHESGQPVGVFDWHLWLDPVNAAILADEIASRLAAADPSHADHYRSNADVLKARLTEVSVQISALLDPVRDRRYVVFHDAYQYFEHRFGVEPAGVITFNPELTPGAQRVAEARASITVLGAVCVFAEPQFEPRIVAVVTEGTNARSAVLDPLGAALENGSELYFNLLLGMAESMRECLLASP